MPQGTGKTTWAMKYPDSLVDIDTICMDLPDGHTSNRYYNKLCAASRTKIILDAIKTNSKLKNKIFLIHTRNTLVIKPLHFNILTSVKLTLKEMYDVAAQRLQFNGSSTPRLIEWWEESDATVMCRRDIDIMLQQLINIDKSII